jgi:osmotically inducible protein OsmC
MKTLYTAEALATGEGRDGHGRTSDGKLDLDLAIPTEMGGSGNGTNPEQLFAVGYAACFHSALRLVGRQEKVDVSDSAVGAQVSLGQIDNGGFGLAVELEVSPCPIWTTTPRSS